MRKRYRILLTLLLLLLLCCGCKRRIAETAPPETAAETRAESSIQAESPAALPETAAESSVPEDRGTEADAHPKAPTPDYLQELELPPYSGAPYVAVHGNQPFFDTASTDTTAYETYYELDPLGRCTLAEAVVGIELMPTEKRGGISAVKPTGWHSDRYPQSLVDGESLYNRCHLIAFALTGENANPWNLITGTRYFNTAGMNSFENMVVDYIRATKNHVHYRVTPVFTGNNLVCDGVLMEGWSVEDGGEDICYCVFAYNVQPGIEIDYATGRNRLADGSGDFTPETAAPELPTLTEDREGDFVLNTKKKTIHRPDCEGAVSMSEKNRQEYSGSYNRLIRDGYKPCPGCEPEKSAGE